MRPAILSQRFRVTLTFDDGNTYQTTEVAISRDMAIRGATRYARALGNTDKIINSEALPLPSARAA
jgi:hypothetical protein